ncbi:MAG TPA: linear amide C-N hydrolase [Roseiarcus sp.]
MALEVQPRDERDGKGGGHLALADASGDSAIFEYISGKLVIHHDRKYTVMTNSPT